MSSQAYVLFKNIINELNGYNEEYHKCFKQSRNLNGIIRKTTSGYLGVIVKSHIIYRFYIENGTTIKMTVRKSVFPITITTKRSLVIFTENGVIKEFDVIKTVSESITNDNFWKEILNSNYNGFIVS